MELRIHCKGILLHLENDTRERAYITFAVNWVARLTNNSLEESLQDGGNVFFFNFGYLKGIHEKNFIVKPDGTFDLNCFLDSDFVYLYGW